MLELRNVTKRFLGIAAVDTVSFRPRRRNDRLSGPERLGQNHHDEDDHRTHRADPRGDPFDGAPIQRDLIAYKQRMGYVPEEPHFMRI